MCSQMQPRLMKDTASMLRENPQKRPNIYQVLKESLAMRGKEVPIRDVRPTHLQTIRFANPCRFILAALRRKIVGIRFCLHHQRNQHQKLVPFSPPQFRNARPSFRISLRCAEDDLITLPRAASPVHRLGESPATLSRPWTTGR